MTHSLSVEKCGEATCKNTVGERVGTKFLPCSWWPCRIVPSSDYERRYKYRKLHEISNDLGNTALPSNIRSRAARWWLFSHDSALSRGCRTDLWLPSVTGATIRMTYIKFHLAGLERASIAMKTIWHNLCRHCWNRSMVKKIGHKQSA